MLRRPVSIAVKAVMPGCTASSMHLQLYCRAEQSRMWGEQEDQEREEEAKLLESARYQREIELAKREAMAEEQRRRAGYLAEQVRCCATRAERPLTTVADQQPLLDPGHAARAWLKQEAHLNAAPSRV